MKICVAITHPPEPDISADAHQGSSEQGSHSTAIPQTGFKYNTPKTPSFPVPTGSSSEDHHFFTFLLALGRQFGINLPELQVQDLNPPLSYHLPDTWPSASHNLSYFQLSLRTQGYLVSRASPIRHLNIHVIPMDYSPASIKEHY